MPNYDFKCTNCDYRFERMVPLVEYNSEQKCDVCGHKAERQVTKAPGAAFKGGGWTPKHH